MRRRDFMAGFSAGIALSPLSVRAQQAGMAIVGFLNSASSDLFKDRTTAFLEGLAQTGFADGKNVAIEYRWADGRYERLPLLARELVERGVRVIAAGNLSSAIAAKEATTTIPIVFQSGADPVKSGLVATLHRPERNVTGITTLGVEVGPKRLEFIREVLPAHSVFGLLINPALASAEAQAQAITAAARKDGIEIRILQASSEGQIEAAFAKLHEVGARALIITGDAFFVSRSEQLARSAMRHAVPAIFEFPEFAKAGGLMSYGGSFKDAYLQVGIYTGRILAGARPADLPVHQATKLELVINLRTAKALGLTIPPTLLARADEVIE